jgi:hypothetical protein
MAVDIVRQIEAEGHYPQADYAFDQGVLTHPLTQLIEVKRHFCLSCVAQSALQSASCSGQKSERFDFADNHEQPIGQRLYTLSREAVQQVVELTQVLLHQGQSVAQIMEFRNTISCFNISR